MAKEFTYRGKELEELKALDTREFAKLLPSRQRRSVLREFEMIEKFVTKCNNFSAKGKQIKTHSRGIVIVPKMIDYTVFVHKGNLFFQVKIIPEMLGHRLGEFAVTRTKVTHSSAGIGATKGTAHASVK